MVSFSNYDDQYNTISSFTNKNLLGLRNSSFEEECLKVVSEVIDVKEYVMPKDNSSNTLEYDNTFSSFLTEAILKLNNLPLKVTINSNQTINLKDESLCPDVYSLKKALWIFQKIRDVLSHYEIDKDTGIPNYYVDYKNDTLVINNNGISSDVSGKKFLYELRGSIPLDYLRTINKAFELVLFEDRENICSSIYDIDGCVNEISNILSRHSDVPGIEFIRDDLRKIVSKLKHYEILSNDDLLFLLELFSTYAKKPYSSNIEYCVTLIKDYIKKYNIKPSFYNSFISSLLYYLSDDEYALLDHLDLSFIRIDNFQFNNYLDNKGSYTAPNSELDKAYGSLVKSLDSIVEGIEPSDPNKKGLYEMLDGIPDANRYKFIKDKLFNIVEEIFDRVNSINSEKRRLLRNALMHRNKEAQIELKDSNTVSLYDCEDNISGRNNHIVDLEVNFKGFSVYTQKVKMLKEEIIKSGSYADAISDVIYFNFRTDRFLSMLRTTLFDYYKNVYPYMTDNAINQEIDDRYLSKISYLIYFEKYLMTENLGINFLDQRYDKYYLYDVDSINDKKISKSYKSKIMNKYRNK